MKHIQYSLLLKTITIPVFCLNLLFLQPAIASDSTNKKEPLKKEAAKKMNSFLSKNNNTIRIHPAIIKREMHVKAKRNNGKEISVFVFDIQGNLSGQYQMKQKEHQCLTGLKKGIYTYCAFSGDEKTASGKFEIR